MHVVAGTHMLIAITLDAIQPFYKLTSEHMLEHKVNVDLLCGRHILHIRYSWQMHAKMMRNSNKVRYAKTLSTFNTQNTFCTQSKV